LENRSTVKVVIPPLDEKAEILDNVLEEAKKYNTYELKQFSVKVTDKNRYTDDINFIYVEDYFVDVSQPSSATTMSTRVYPASTVKLNSERCRYNIYIYPEQKLQTITLDDYKKDIFQGKEGKLPTTYDVDDRKGGIQFHPIDRSRVKDTSDLHDDSKWSSVERRYTANTYVIAAIKKLNVLAYIPNSDWLIVYELLTAFPSLTYTVNGNFNYYDSGSANGSSILAVDHYLKGRPFNWKGRSPYIIAKDTFGVYSENVEKWHTTSGDEGSFTLYISTFRDTTSDSIDLEEEFGSKYFLQEFTRGIKSLSVGGNMVLRWPSMCTFFGVSVLALISKMFNDVHLVKPMASKSTTNEFYIVALNYIKRDSEIEKYLVDRCTKWGTNSIELATPLCSIPYDFTNQIIVPMATLIQNTFTNTVARLSADKQRGHPLYWSIKKNNWLAVNTVNHNNDMGVKIKRDTRHKRRVLSEDIFKKGLALIPDKGGTIECEFRLTGINYDVFDFFKDTFDDAKDTVHEATIKYNNYSFLNSTARETYNPNTQESKWIDKKRLLSVEYDIHGSTTIKGARFSVSSETVTQVHPHHDTYNYVRLIERHIYASSKWGGFKVHLSTVKGGSTTKKASDVSQPKYEVEIEFNTLSDAIRSSKKPHMLDMMGLQTIYNDVSFIDTSLSSLFGGASTIKPMTGEEKDLTDSLQNIFGGDKNYIGMYYSLINRPENFKLHHLKNMVTPAGVSTHGVTVKADGVRYLGYFSSTKFIIFNPGNIVYVGECKSNLAGTVVDIEHMEKGRNRNLAFDCLAYKGKDITPLPMEFRYNKLKGIDCRSMGVKKLFFTGDMEKDVGMANNHAIAEFGKSNDGLIMVDMNGDYRSMQRKYKPHDQISIDFRVQIIKDKVYLWAFDRTQKREVLYRADGFSNPINYSPRDTYRNGDIVEFVFYNNKLTFYRIRTSDKKNPNMVSVVDDNWEDMKNPITVKDIIKTVKPLLNSKQIYFNQLCLEISTLMTPHVKGDSVIGCLNGVYDPAIVQHLVRAIPIPKKVLLCDREVGKMVDGIIQKIGIVSYGLYKNSLYLKNYNFSTTTLDFLNPLHVSQRVLSGVSYSVATCFFTLNTIRGEDVTNLVNTLNGMTVNMGNKVMGCYYDIDLILEKMDEGQNELELENGVMVTRKGGADTVSLDYGGTNVVASRSSYDAFNLGIVGCGYKLVEYKHLEGSYIKTFVYTRIEDRFKNRSIASVDTQIDLPTHIYQDGKPTPLKLCRVGVPGDGSCLIHSILYNSANTRYTLMSKDKRSRIVKKLRIHMATTLHLDMYNSKYSTKGGIAWSEYVKNIRTPTTFLGMDEIQYVMDKLDINIIFINESSRTPFMGGGFLKYDDDKPYIIVLHIDGLHYEPVNECVPDGDNRFLFNGGDAVIQTLLAYTKNVKMATTRMPIARMPIARMPIVPVGKPDEKEYKVKEYKVKEYKVNEYKVNTSNTHHSNTGQKFMAKYHNYVKKNLISDTVQDGSSVLDIGAGKGGDVWKYIDVGVGDLFLVEPYNYKELKDRQRESKWGEKRSGGGTPTNIYTLETKAGDVQGILDMIQSNSRDKSSTVQVASMFFILTFFFENEGSLSRLINTLKSTVVKPGGLVIGTTMDGDKTFERLKGSQEFHNSVVTIKKHYNDDEKKVFGKDITININNSIVTDQHEYLVDFEYFKEKMNEEGFTLISSEFFDYRKYDKTASASYVDFSNLNRWFIFRRD
jgi:hypothetical protein